MVSLLQEQLSMSAHRLGGMGFRWRVDVQARRLLHIRTADDVASKSRIALQRLPDDGASRPYERLVDSRDSARVPGPLSLPACHLGTAPEGRSSALTSGMAGIPNASAARIRGTASRPNSRDDPWIAQAWMTSNARSTPRSGA